MFSTINRFFLFAAFFFYSGLAFSSQPNINHINLGAVEDYYPYYSHDRSQVTFFSNRSGQYQIYIMNSDGSDLTQLTNTKEKNETPIFSRDDSKIFFQSYRDGNAEIYVMNIDGSSQTNLSNNPAEDSHPKLSYQGNKIIFDSMRGDAKTSNLFEMNTDGSEVIQLTSYDEVDSYPSISPDGSKILWRRITPTGGDPRISDSGRNSEIFIMNRDGSEIKNLTKHPAFDGYPFFSPDSKRIVFSSTRDRKNDEGDKYDSNIYTMNIDGSDIKRLTTTIPFVEQVRPMWSDDGSTIIFNRDNLHENSDQSGVKIYELELD